MVKRVSMLLVAIALLVAFASPPPPQAQQDYPMLDMIAQKVIDKYNNANCVQLATMKSEKPTGEKAELEARLIQALKNDPQMRKAFLDKVAAPIANRMFECGMIP